MRSQTAIIILCLMLFACNYTYAADEWTKIPISGGNIICMKEFPENSKILLCCTQKGGLFRSSNEGNNWIEILSGEFFDIAVAESGKVFCAGESGLFYSEDYGITFNNILPHFTSEVVCNTNGIVIADTSYKQFDYNYFFSPYLISNDFGGLWQIFKGTADTLFLKPELKRGSFLFMEDGSVLRSAGEKIYKSDGINWNNWKLIFGNSHYDTKLIKLFQFDSSKGLLYGYSKYHDYHPIEQYYGGFWQSPDTGKTWNEVINVSSVTSLERYTNEQESTDIFFIGTAEGGIVTFDNNKKITETIGALGGEVTSIIVSGWMNGKLIVSTTGGIYSTSDYGVTWIKSDEGIYQVEVNAVQAIDVDNHDRIVAAINNSGIWTSDDNGITWQSVNKNIFITAGMLKKSPHSSELLIGGGSEIFQSNNGGLNWLSTIYGDFPAAYYGWYSRFSQITFHPLNNSEVFINYYDHSPDDYRGTIFLRGIINDSSIVFDNPEWVDNSLKNMGNFQFEGNIFWNIKAVYDFPNSDYYLVGTDTNTGDSIKSMKLPKYNNYYSYWYMENNNCFYFAGDVESNHLWISKDYGAYWEEKNIDFPNHLIAIDWNAENYPGGFVKSPVGDYYLFTSGNGVYSSSDNGETWRTMNEGLSSLVALQLDFSPTNPDVLYLVTYDGLYKRNVTTKVEEKDNNVISDFFFNNYPNPFNAETKLTFTVTKEGDCKLKVFDLLGNEIETLIDRKLPAGKHSHIFNAAKYPSGVYFYSLYMGNQVYTNKMILLK